MQPPAIWPKLARIKHSLPTALRAAVSKLESQHVRLAKKTAPPDGRIKCGLLGAGNFFNYAYAPALNKKNSPLAVTGILARDKNKFSAAQKKPAPCRRTFF